MNPLNLSLPRGPRFAQRLLALTLGALCAGQAFAAGEQAGREAAAAEHAVAVAAAVGATRVFARCGERCCP